MSDLPRTSVITRLKKVESVSFSDYIKFSDCLVSSWPSKCVELQGGRASSSISRAVVVGLLYHDLLKALDEIEHQDYEDGVREIRARFTELLGTYRARYRKLLADNHPPFDYWPEVTAIVRSVIEAFQLQLDKARKPVREKEVSSQRLRMHGVIDEFWATERAVELVEYKTTQDSSRLAVDRHIEQIHFYALLVKELCEKPIQAQLRGLLGASCTVPIEEDRMLAISRRVERFFEKSDLVSETDDVAALCSVSRNSCPNCAYQFSCPVILRKSSPSIGDGKEIAVMSNLVSDGDDVRAEVTAGTVPLGTWLVGRSQLVGELDAGQGALVIGGLAISDGTLSLSPDSRAFVLDDQS